MIEPAYLMIIMFMTIFIFILKMILNKDDLHAFAFFTLT